MKSGDYEQAYLYASVYNNYKDSLSRLVQSSDLAELTAQLDNERMKLEAKVLEYKKYEVESGQYTVGIGTEPVACRIGENQCREQ